MRTLILTVLLAMVSFSSLAKSKPNGTEQCQAWHLLKAYELELNRTWWYQGTSKSGYDLIEIEDPQFSYDRGNTLGCTTVVVMKNFRTGKTQKYFNAFTVTKHRSGTRVDLKAPITLSPSTMR